MSEDPTSVPSVEVTWIARGLPSRGYVPEVALAHARLEASMFPDGREPARVGRYLILDRVGSGGMGVVYAAYDPELDRKVAIKILHSVHGDAQHALLREARALARLSHPNVVGVHDVGTFELSTRRDEALHELMFVAMEFIEGQSLASWLRERGRTHREVLDLMLEAGEGLAAAHAVGIVHRDFKPDNVLVDREGHAHVVDFGLARAHVDRASATTTGDDHDTAAPDDDEGGTPAYMSPEQVGGTTTDGRTDQFSFCVTLWEAVYGERPFGGSSLVELAANILDGQRRPPPRGVRVPRWLRVAIERGLMVDPDDRWPSFAALLDALRRGRARARSYGLLAGVGVVAVSIATLVAYDRVAEQRAIAACERAGATIEDAWNDEQRVAVRESLLASGAPAAALTADKLAPWLDAQATAWQEARTEACLAVTVRETWTDDTTERAVWCLDERRFELQSLVAELREADIDTAMRAVPSAAQLQQVDPCLDVTLLDRLPAPPTEAREEVQSIRADLSRAATLTAIARYDEGLELARECLRPAENVGWGPVAAAARVRVGTLLELLGQYREAEPAFEAAYFEAATSGANEDALRAAQALASLVGNTLMRPQEGERWARLGDVMRATLPDPAGLWEAAGDESLAVVKGAIGDFDGAVKLHERALALRERALGPDHPELAATINNIAVVRRHIGEYAEAVALHERGIAIWERTVGPEHPNVARATSALAQVKAEMGAYEEAMALAERSRAQIEGALGPDHPDVASVLNMVATVHNAVGEFGEAAELNERALRIIENAVGPNHPSVGGVLNDLATTREGLGDHAGATRLLERTLRIWERMLGPEHPDIALCLNNLSSAALAMGEYEKAKAQLERALAIWEKSYGPGHPRVAGALNNLAGVHQQLGEWPEAGRLYERALVIWEQTLGTTHPLYASSLDGLAMVREEEGAWDEAAELHQRTLVIREAALGPDNPELARAVEGLGRVALAQHRGADAVAYAERAVRLREASRVPPEELADARFLLARALVAVGSEHARAITLATAARDAYREAGAGEQAAVESTEAWLREHAKRP